MFAPIWTDEHGIARRVPRTLTPLIKRFVRQRDNYTCQRCGLYFGDRIAVEMPDGKSRYLDIDHKLAIRNGGTHHPDNLRVFCSACNAWKAGRIDVPLSRLVPHYESLGGVIVMWWV